MRKVTIIGGAGIRTPLLVHGLAQAQGQLSLSEIALYDIDSERAALITALCREAARQLNTDIKITLSDRLEDAVSGASFIIHSIRVGGIEARARDERLAIEHGIAGQETTGLGGLAKALRTIPVVLEQARIIERLAPQAWLISFTNPAGLMTQALMQHTSLKVIGICDTPTEIFHRLAQGLGVQPNELQCDYFGLNHLGWVRRVMVRGKDVTMEVLNNDALLRSLYSADLFDPAMIRALGLIPSEYLYFYYCQQRALAHQRAAGASRGEEIAQLNEGLFASLQSALRQNQPAQALEIYRAYLRRRSGSYLKLEAEAGSALREDAEQAEDPFDAATGYHRIALEVMAALLQAQPQTIVLNVRNGGALPELADDDVVEVPCSVSEQGAQPQPCGTMPATVLGLVQAVKEYERLTICAAVDRSVERAHQALLVYPLVGQWQPSHQMINALIAAHPGTLSYLRP